MDSTHSTNHIARHFGLIWQSWQPWLRQFICLCWQPWQRQSLVIPKPISFCLHLLISKWSLSCLIVSHIGYYINCVELINFSICLTEVCLSSLLTSRTLYNTITALHHTAILKMFYTSLAFCWVYLLLAQKHSVFPPLIHPQPIIDRFQYWVN